MSINSEFIKFKEKVRSGAIGWYRQGYHPKEISKLMGSSLRTIYRYLDITNIDPQIQIEHKRNRVLRMEQEKGGDLVENSEGIESEQSEL